MSGSAAVRMAGDLAHQFAHLSTDDGAALITAHIRTYWEPRMRAELVAEVEAGAESVDPLLRTIAALLAQA